MSEGQNEQQAPRNSNCSSRSGAGASLCDHDIKAEDIQAEDHSKNEASSFGKRLEAAKESTAMDTTAAADAGTSRMLEDVCAFSPARVSAGAIGAGPKATSGSVLVAGVVNGEYEEQQRIWDVINTNVTPDLGATHSESLQHQQQEQVHLKDQFADPTATPLGANLDDFRLLCSDEHALDIAVPVAAAVAANSYEPNDEQHEGVSYRSSEPLATSLHFADELRGAMGFDTDHNENHDHHHEHSHDDMDVYSGAGSILGVDGCAHTAEDTSLYESFCPFGEDLSPEHHHALVTVLSSSSRKDEDEYNCASTTVLVDEMQHQLQIHTASGHVPMCSPMKGTVAEYSKHVKTTRKLLSMCSPQKPMLLGTSKKTCSTPGVVGPARVGKNRRSSRKRVCRPGLKKAVDGSCAPQRKNARTTKAAHVADECTGPGMFSGSLSTRLEAIMRSDVTTGFSESGKLREGPKLDENRSLSAIDTAIKVAMRQRRRVREERRSAEALDFDDVRNGGDSFGVQSSSIAGSKRVGAPLLGGVVDITMLEERAQAQKPIMSPPVTRKATVAL